MWSGPVGRGWLVVSDFFLKRIQFFFGGGGEVGGGGGRIFL